MGNAIVLHGAVNCNLGN